MATEQDRSAVPSPLAMLLAWLVPGLGHWILGERIRAVVFFVVINATFWGGVAIGGVRTTVTSRENGAWIAAQLCAGPQTLAALYLSQKQDRLAQAAGREVVKAPWPSSSIAVVYSGVAGLLNLLVILNALVRAEAAAGAEAKSSAQRREAS